MIAHSFGSLLSYTAIANNPDWPLTTFITLGSPLATPLIYAGIDPVPAEGDDIWPGRIERWVSIRAVGDKAAEVALSTRFGERVEEVLVDNGQRAHDPEPYLSAPATGKVIAEALAG